MAAFLKRNANLIGVLLLLFSMLNVFLRFFGSWANFLTALLVQLWFAQAVYSYLVGGRVSIGPGGLGKDADPVWRGMLAGLAFFAYCVVFFLDFNP